jgi:hypothetical protein
VIILALVFSIIISTGSIAWGYAGAGFQVVTGWIISFGALWIFSLWRKWRWFSSLGLLLSILLAIFGLWFNFIIGWIFSGSIFALFAWDLTEFQQKIKLVPAREDVKGMTRRHLARISLLALGGLLFASALMFWWGQFNDEWGMFVGSVVALGLTQIVAWIKK